MQTCGVVGTNANYERRKTGDPDNVNFDCDNEHIETSILGSMAFTYHYFIINLLTYPSQPQFLHVKNFIAISKKYTSFHRF